MNDSLRYRPSTLEIIASAVCMLSVIFVSLNKFADWGFSSRFFLVLASTAFVAVPAFGGALKTLYGRFVLIAIVFCWLGDFTGPYHFLVGAGFFLIGHLFLIVSYAIHGIEKKRLAFATPVALAVSGIIAYYIVPNVFAHERWFVISYITVITVMAILACSAKGRITFALLLVGAITFYISDVFLALNRYTAANVNYTYFGYPLYYAACVLFGLSASADRWEKNPCR